MAASASERVRNAVTRTHAAGAVVAQYVAGESSEDAVAVARTLHAAGLLVTLDYLGEETTDAQRAAATVAQYVHLLGKLAAEGLTEGGAVEVSVKPTAVGLLLGTEGQPRPNAIGERVAIEHLERIVSAAADAGTTVTIDAEDHTTTDAALRIAGSLRSRFPSVGTVLQAALRRTEADARAALQGRVRRARRRGVRYQARGRQVVRPLPARPDDGPRLPDDRDARSP